MSSTPNCPRTLKYVPAKKWRRFGRSSFRNARNLSKRLNHLFRRKNSYSLLSKKSKNSYEIINFYDGTNVAPLTAAFSARQAQVWGVRNCFSKSAAEDLQFDLDLDQKRDRKSSIVGAQSQDISVAESLKDSGIATSGDSEIEERKVDKQSEKEEDCTEGLSGEAEAVACTGMDIRGRLQSFDSSLGGADSLVACSTSSSPREPGMSDDFTSIDSLDNMETSYWDLPINDNYDGLSCPRRNRRYSESVVSDPRLVDGSPRLRFELANRRMSESWAIRTGNLYRSFNGIPERRHSVNLGNTSGKGTDVPDSISESGRVLLAKENDAKEMSEKESIDKDTPVKEDIPKLLIPEYRLPEKKSVLQRSRSADSRKLQRSKKKFRRNSLMLERRAAFSDIESSDESVNVQSYISSDDVASPRPRGRITRAGTLPSSRRTNDVACRMEQFDSSRDSLIEKSDDEGTIEDGISEGGDSEKGLDFLPVKDVMFCSGENGKLAAGEDDMKEVIKAVQREADKAENVEKDMMVMFLVGGELKVLRRSALPNHGDRSFQDLPSMTKKDRFSFHNGSSNNVSHNYSSGYGQRPMHEANRGRPKSAIIITRSQSFAGMASLPSTPRREGTQSIVLGESFRHHRGATMPSHPKPSPSSRGSTGFSFKKSPKVPKVPRPNRALLMFQSVKRGVREFIEATKDDIFQLQQRETDGTSTAQGRLHETDKQLKSAERYLKRLEFHLAKLDELHEYYMLQQQLREGVRTMHRAYVTSPGTRKQPLSNVKYGYKECTQTMCNIEAQLEAMMGTFNCKLKGIAGFARLCPGDVFEVTVRHGTQKWKSKGRIEKSGNQKWEVPDFNFKAVVGDVINIKGVEVRAFKSVLLGQKSCETKDLFSANPQLMTVSINVNGSLKLSIVIIWNPLDGVDENFTFIETPLRTSQGTPRRTRPVSVLALNGQYEDYEQMPQDRRHSQPISVQQTKDDNFILRTGAAAGPGAPDGVVSYHGLDSPHVAARHSEHLPAVYQTQPGPIYTQTSGHLQAGFHSNPVLTSADTTNFAQQMSLPANQSSVHSSAFPTSSFSHLHFPGVTSSSHGHENGEDAGNLNIEDVLHNLSSVLEDYHGQYVELQKLEDLVKYAQKLMRKQFRNSSRSSSISVSIEDALEAFDFLDTEDTLEDPQSPTDNAKSSFDDLLCSPESTAKTADSGIESLAQRLSEDHTQLGSSLDSSPTPPTTGNEEVDQCLIYHLTYCERLLENLGQFGPLKCHEIYALDKIQKQCSIIDCLLKLAKTGSQSDLHSVMSSLCEDKALREFWVKCTDENSLYVHPDRLVTSLEQKFATVIQDTYMLDPSNVCQHVITRVLDIPDYEQERGRSTFVMTLHQFMFYFKEEGGLKHIEDVASEMKLVERLTSGHPDTVIKAIVSLGHNLPSAPCLRVIGMLLVTSDSQVQQCTISYLNLVQRQPENRDKAMVVFVEGLEDKTAEIRAGSCAALAILEASESTDQLVYLWQSDSSSLVQQKAKTTLLSLGEEGKKAFEDAQLSKHGFQGLQVHK